MKIDFKKSEIALYVIYNKIYEKNTFIAAHKNVTNRTLYL